MSRYHKLINPKNCVFETKMAYNWGQAGLLKYRTIHHWCSWNAVDQLIVLISHGAYLVCIQHHLMYLFVCI